MGKKYIATSPFTYRGRYYSASADRPFRIEIGDDEKPSVLWREEGAPKPEPPPPPEQVDPGIVEQIAADTGSSGPQFAEVPTRKGETADELGFRRGGPKPPKRASDQNVL